MATPVPHRFLATSRMRSTTIGADETYGELQDRLAILAAEMAVEWMPRIVAGDYPRRPQNAEHATIAPKVEKAEGELSFDRPAVEGQLHRDDIPRGAGDLGDDRPLKPGQCVDQ